MAAKVFRTIEEQIDILKRNNEEEIKEYLLRFCKQPKPISPFCYINTKEDNDNDSK